MVERMTELSAQYPRYGYRRIRIFLDRDGHAMSPGRAHRLWRTARLQDRASGRGSASLPPRGHGRKRRADRTKCGPTTSFSTIAPTVNSSSA